VVAWVRCGHGGKRAGAGAKSKTEVQLVEATNLLERLQDYKSAGLGRIGENFDTLVEKELKTALIDHESPEFKSLSSSLQRGLLNEAPKARRFLIKHFIEAVPLQSDSVNPLQKLADKWGSPQQTIVEGDLIVNPLAEKGERLIIDAEHKPVG